MDERHEARPVGPKEDVAQEADVENIRHVSAGRHAGRPHGASCRVAASPPCDREPQWLCASLTGRAGLSGLRTSAEPEMTQIDRDHHPVAERLQVRPTHVGPALRRKAEPLHLQHVIDILRRRKPARHLDVIVVPA